MAEEKGFFDRAYLAGDFRAIEYDVTRTPLSAPSLAVSSLFSLGDSAHTEKALQATLNVFPYEGRHVVVPSSRRPARQAAQVLGFALKSTIGGERFRTVSCVVLKNCENLVLRSRLFRSFGCKQRRVLRKYFEETTFAPQFGPLEVVPFPEIVSDADIEKLNLYKVVDR